MQLYKHGVLYTNEQTVLAILPLGCKCKGNEWPL